MKDETLTVGLIGAGRIGRVHGRHLQRQIRGATVAAIADVDADAAAQCAEELGVETSTSDFREILNREDIGGVIVCSPTTTHLEVIAAACAAGKHVFCEKPLDSTLERIDRALKAVHEAGVLLQVGFNRRFDANFQRVRQAVRQGEIGNVHQVHIISRDPAPPPLEYIRQSGGLFIDMTIHDFDMARFLVGDEVVRVFAAGDALLDRQIAEAGDLDTATIVLEFRDGAVAVIQNSRKAVYGYDQRVEVFGSAGSICADNNYPNTAVLSDASTVRRDLPLNFFMDRYLASYLLEMQEFVDAVRARGPSPLSGDEARPPVAMAIAARQSWEQKQPVSLPVSA